MQLIAKTLTAKQAAKAKAKADKAASSLLSDVAPPDVAPIAATPSKADIAAKANEHVSAMRAIAATVYNGPSLAVHTSKRCMPLADYLARVTMPVQCANSETVRDASALLAAFRNTDGTETFCPVSYAADIGAISRLSSLQYLIVSGQRIGFTPSGLSRAKAIAAKA